MKVVIMSLDTQTFVEYECDSFEFRANQVSNWVKLKKEGKEIACIKRVSVFKNIDTSVD